MLISISIAIGSPCSPPELRFSRTRNKYSAKSTGRARLVRVQGIRNRWAGDLGQPIAARCSLPSSGIRR
jgi:hypothetical protein